MSKYYTKQDVKGRTIYGRNDQGYSSDFLNLFDRDRYERKEKKATKIKKLSEEEQARINLKELLR